MFVPVAEKSFHAGHRSRSFQLGIRKHFQIPDDILKQVILEAFGLAISWSLFSHRRERTKIATQEQANDNDRRPENDTDCSARLAFYRNDPNDAKPDSRNLASYRNASTYATT